MVTTDDIRGFALALPEVEEFIHFRQQVPGYKVRGKAFAGMERGETTAVFSVSLEDAAAAAAADPAVYEEVWRPGRIRSLVGVRVQLAKVSERRVQELIEQAWRNKAPKRVVAAYDCIT